MAAFSLRLDPASKVNRHFLENEYGDVFSGMTLRVQMNKQFLRGSQCEMQQARCSLWRNSDAEIAGVLFSTSFSNYVQVLGIV